MRIPGYSIERLIGKGGMSAVYLAVQESLNRRVALKVMKRFDDPRQAERFLHEGQIIAALNHRNIITIHDVGAVGDRHYIAMEYLEGRSLSERIEEGMPLAKVLSLLEQMAACLHFVHRRGIIHRDIKPSNILFHADGTPKLTDFGIAKLINADQEMTLEGNALGSPYYLSPEQAEGLPLDGRSDIYALGIVFYQMLTGERPYAKGTPVETIVAHLTQPLPVLPEQYLGYQDLLEAMIAKSPDARVASAKELVYRIREAKRATPPGERAGDRRSSASVTPQRPGRRRLAAALPALAAAVVLAAVIVGLWPDGDDAGAPEQPSSTLAGMTPPDGATAGGAAIDTSPVPGGPSAGATAQAAALSAISATDPGIPRLAVVEPRPTADAHEDADAPPSRPDATADSGESSPAGADDVLAGLADTDVADNGGASASDLVSDSRETGPAPGEAAPATADADGTDKQPAAAAGVAVTDRPDTSADTRAAQIDTWMLAADEALASLRLTRPADDNAFAYYRKVLDTEPGHAGARAGLQNIAARYHDMASRALRRDQPGRARRYVRRGLSVRPGDSALLALRAQIAAQQQLAAADPEPSTEVPPSAAGPAPPDEPQSLRDREGSGNIVEDFGRVWRAVFD